MALLNEYRIALGIWSDTRALYSPETCDVVETESDLEDLEGDIIWLYGKSALPLTDPASALAVKYYDIRFDTQQVS